jgi:hypothetical protein
MHIRESVPIVLAVLLTWAIVLISIGAMPSEGWIPFAALAVCALMLLRTRGDGDRQGRRPPPRWGRGRPPVPADCPEWPLRRSRRAAWVPPRLRYEVVVGKP